MLSDISKIIDKNHFERAIYAGAIREQVKYSGNRLIMSIRGIYFEATNSTTPSEVKNTIKQSTQYPELLKPKRQQMRLIYQQQKLLYQVAEA